MCSDHQFLLDTSCIVDFIATLYYDKRKGNWHMKEGRFHWRMSVLSHVKCVQNKDMHDIPR